MTPTSATIRFDDDLDAVTAVSVEDAFRKTADPKPHRVDEIKVTVFFNGEASTLGAQGRPLTKSGAVDRRATYSGLVVISDEDEARFIAAAEAVVRQNAPTQP